MINKIAALILIASILAIGIILLVVSHDQENDFDLSGDETNNLTIQTKEGIVTAIQSDCEAKIFIDNQGDIREETEVLCDAGSFISLGNFTVQTASGFVEEQDSFKVSVENIKLKDRVRATYKQLTPTTGTLDCDECSIVLIKN